MDTSTFARVMLVMPFISNAFIYLQAYKIWERQSHDDVSFLTAIFSIISAAVWGYYGWVINSTPLLLSGIIATIGFILIVYMKLLIPSKAANGWRWI
jgi:uncharacterized protein with PQ loop repeat